MKLGFASSQGGRGGAGFWITALYPEGLGLRAEWGRVLVNSGALGCQALPVGLSAWVRVVPHIVRHTGRDRVRSSQFAQRLQISSLGGSHRTLW